MFDLDFLEFAAFDGVHGKRHGLDYIFYCLSEYTVYNTVSNPIEMS